MRALFSLVLFLAYSGALLIEAPLFAAPAASNACNHAMSAAAESGESFPSLNGVLAIHERDINQFGGLQGLRAQDQLESAIASVGATWGGQDLYPTVFDKAAALAVHISESQPFFDGNKRTALDSALTFLALNGYEVKPQAMELFNAMIEVANKTMSREKLAALFSSLAKKAEARAPAAVPDQTLVLRVSDRERQNQSHVFEKLVSYDRR